MILRSPKNMKIQIFVMPAMDLAAHGQVCKDASGNIHVNLDSSTSMLEGRNRRGSALN